MKNLRTLGCMFLICSQLCVSVNVDGNDYKKGIVQRWDMLKESAVRNGALKKFLCASAAFSLMYAALDSQAKGPSLLCSVYALKDGILTAGVTTASFLAAEYLPDTVGGFLGWMGIGVMPPLYTIIYVCNKRNILP